MFSNRTATAKTLQRKFLDAGLLFFLGAILIAAGLLSGIVGMRLAVRRTEVVVPLVLGATTEEARETLSGRELALQVIGERYDANVPTGRVLIQYPTAGGRLKARRPVQVILSLGNRTHAVPKLTGSTVQVARLNAAQYNYEIGHVTRVALGGFGEDVVISQYPSPGAAEVSSPRIDLLVSDGQPDRFVMPDLTGKNLNEVEPFLSEAGFEVDSIAYRFYANAKKGMVVKHFPESGSLLAAEDAIHLEVAR